MALPSNANRIVVRFRWLNSRTGKGEPKTVTFDPVPLSGSTAPNVTDLAEFAWIKTQQETVTPNADTGYAAVALLANDDEHLTAFGGWRVTPQGETPFVIAVSVDSPTITVDQAMKTAIPDLVLGEQVQAMWLTEAALVDTVPPPPPTAWLTAGQTVSTIASGIDEHDQDGAAHPDIRALIGSGGGGISQGDLDDAIAELPFRADNTTTTGAAPGQVPTVSEVNGGVPSFVLTRNRRPVAAGITMTAYGDSLARPVAPAIVAIGDSITDNNHTSTVWNGSSGSRTSALRGDGYLTRAMIMVRQRATAHELGVSGQTTAQMLARFAADVLPLNPAIVIEAGGTNDARTGVAAETIIANKLAMWKMAIDAGAKVITTTVPPANDSTVAQRNTVQVVNAAIRGFALTHPSLTVIDWYPDLVDPLTGGVVAARFDAAGVHPNTLGAFIVAAKFAAAITNLLGPATMDPLPSDNVNDLDNCLNTPLFTGTVGGMTSGGTGQVAQGWYGSTSSTTVAFSKVARADGLGEWQQATLADAATLSLQRSIRAGSWAVGDAVQATVEFETEAASWVDGAFDARLLALNGGTIMHLAAALSLPPAETVIKGRHASGVLRTPPVVVPTGTTDVRMDLVKTGAGTVRWGRAQARRYIPA